MSVRPAHRNPFVLGKLKRWLALAALLAAGAIPEGRAQPAATGPAATPAATPTPAPEPSPRDALPFTKADFEGLNPALPTLFIAGDSTAATGNPTHRGWGAVLIDYFDPAKINVVNRGVGGATFPSYYQRFWPAIVAAIKPGDFVVIELGHNTGHLAGLGEETQQRAARGGRRGAAAASAPTTETIHTFGWYIRTFAADVKAKGATPIICTITIRNSWKDGKIVRGKGELVPWATQEAAADHLLFIDHHNIGGDRFDALGQEAVAKFFPADYLHTGTEGAIVNAETFIAGLKTLTGVQPVLDALNDKGKAIAAYQPQSK
jgi:lysophospholipase L1-like esterase